jgi:hypothetical protein
MANTVTTRTILDGPRKAVVEVYVKSDGAAGELSDQNIVDISTLTAGRTPARVSVCRIQGHLQGFSGLLEWDQTTDAVLHSLPDSDVFDWEFPVPITNPQGSGYTGDIFLTTAGFTAATDEGTIVFTLNKHA